MKITRTAAGATIETSEGTVTVDGATVTFSPPPKMTIGEVAQPAPAPWWEALKPGDKFERIVNGPEHPWMLVTFDSLGSSGGHATLHMREGGWMYAHNCRPLSTPAVDADTDVERVRDALVVARASLGYEGHRADAAEAKLSASESLLSAERATVSRQAEEIAKLRASALVVPEVVVRECRLPWSFCSDSTTHYILDADGFPVGRIDTDRLGVKEDSLLASAIVAAANGGAK